MAWLIVVEGRETPAGAKRRGGSQTPRGKRVSCNGNQHDRLTETFYKRSIQAWCGRPFFVWKKSVIFCYN
jgi:hypothetical protein